jgi:hypothetical protein
MTDQKLDELGEWGALTDRQRITLLRREAELTST